jgi:predicted enzyme related to lactoylglutathione lyase
MAEIRSRNWESLCTFYGETLGLPERMVDKKGQFAMYGEAAPFVALVGKKDANEGVSRVVLDFVVADLDACLAELGRRGVEPSGPPEPSPEGYRIARLSDPEGNLIHLFEWTSPGGAASSA